MTPTLLGRWETRFFLLATVGVIITLIVGLVVKNVVTPFLLLGYVFLFGLAWDALYQYILTFRWDRDWPTSFQVLAGVVEGALVWLLVHYVGLPGIPSTAMPFAVFISMYASIWLITFIIAQGPLRTLLVRWRYQGGEWF
ncbi:MAG TPA: hypothetical protein VH599_06395 [Ktedonobacterales bacterium]|jgi:hypothetical protein